MYLECNICINSDKDKNRVLSTKSAILIRRSTYTRSNHIQYNVTDNRWFVWGMIWGSVLKRERLVLRHALILVSRHSTNHPPSGAISSSRGEIFLSYCQQGVRTEDSIIPQLIKFQKCDYNRILCQKKHFLWKTIKKLIQRKNFVHWTKSICWIHKVLYRLNQILLSNQILSWTKQLYNQLFSHNNW